MLWSSRMSILDKIVHCTITRWCHVKRHPVNKKSGKSQHIFIHTRQRYLSFVNWKICLLVNGCSSQQWFLHLMYWLTCLCACCNISSGTSWHDIHVIWFKHIVLHSIMHQINRSIDSHQNWGIIILMSYPPQSNFCLM